jgi:hypothetical protein
MEWQEALEVVISTTKHERYRQLCSEENPDHIVWREKMIAKATATPRPRPIQERIVYPPMGKQMMNFVGAMGRVGSAIVKREQVLATQEEYDRRWAICKTNACGRFDAKCNRCLECGCKLAAKLRLQTEHCPLDFW